MIIGRCAAEPDVHSSGLFLSASFADPSRLIGHKKLRLKLLNSCFRNFAVFILALNPGKMSLGIST